MKSSDSSKPTANGPRVTGDSSAILEELRRTFVDGFGEDPRLFAARGRVNLIGDHTDYNDGFVLPMAIDRTSYAAISARLDDKVNVSSLNFPERSEFSTLHGAAPKTGAWSDYIVGVYRTLQSNGIHLPGANLIVGGSVPIGAGLSSSAALEVSVAMAFLSLTDTTLDPLRLAQLCQQAEWLSPGTQCGIMDQYVACFGELGHALLIDCRSLRHESVPLPSNVLFAVCDSGVRHALATGEYNLRRAECQEGLEILQGEDPSIRALRDATPAALSAARARMPEAIYRRCRHVIYENLRVQDASAALRSADLDTFGRLMNDSHRSLRDDYQVSCAELDSLVEIAAKIPGVFGSRMTGGGFGGSTISILAPGARPTFEKQMASEYQKRFGRLPQIHFVVPSGAACRVA